MPEDENTERFTSAEFTIKKKDGSVIEVKSEPRRTEERPREKERKD